MQNDALIKDLQEIAALAAQMVAGMEKKNLTELQKPQVDLLTKRGFLTEDKRTGLVGEARTTDHK